VNICTIIAIIFLWVVPSYASFDPRCIPLLEHLEKPFLTFDDIHYQTFGPTDGELLILIHGLDSAWATFANVVDELSKKYRVIVYDQRGHGKTVAKGQRYDSDTMASDLKVLMDGLGIQSANILGHSMGARTAMKFAEVYPDRVKSLIIEDMELISRTKFDPGQFQEILVKAEELEKMPTHYSSRDALVQALEPLYGNEALSLTYRRAKANPDGSFDLLFRPDVSLLYGYLANMEDMTDALVNFSKPILILMADPKKGSAISKEGLGSFLINKPGIEIHTIPDSSHTLHRTHPNEFLTHVDNFINRNNKEPDKR
jgi:esterase